MTTPKYDDSKPFYRVPNSAVHGPHLKFKPIVYTPLTRWTEQWFSYADTKCAPYESLLLKCAYQGSRRKMEERCIKELEDLEECLFKPKQIARYEAIQKERMKQRKYEELPISDVFHERHAK